jgi:hypothetical protein
VLALLRGSAPEWPSVPISPCASCGFLPFNIESLVQICFVFRGVINLRFLGLERRLSLAMGMICGIVSLLQYVAVVIWVVFHLFFFLRFLLLNLLGESRIDFLIPLGFETVR